MESLHSACNVKFIKETNILKMTYCFKYRPLKYLRTRGLCVLGFSDTLLSQRAWHFTASHRTSATRTGPQNSFKSILWDEDSFKSISIPATAEGSPTYCPALWNYCHYTCIFIMVASLPLSARPSDWLTDEVFRRYSIIYPLLHNHQPTTAGVVLSSQHISQWRWALLQVLFIFISGLGGLYINCCDLQSVFVQDLATLYTIQPGLVRMYYNRTAIQIDNIYSVL